MELVKRGDGRPIGASAGAASVSKAEKLRRGRSAFSNLVSAMSLPLVPAEEFDNRAQAEGFGRIGETGVAAARQVLVEGRGLSEVARNLNVSRQFVDKCSRKVRAVLDDLPSDWERVDAWFPPDVAPVVREMARLAAEQYKARKR